MFNQNKSLNGQLPAIPQYVIATGAGQPSVAGNYVTTLQPVYLYQTNQSQPTQFQVLSPVIASNFSIGNPNQIQVTQMPLSQVSLTQAPIVAPLQSLANMQVSHSQVPNIISNVSSLADRNEIFIQPKPTESSIKELDSSNQSLSVLKFPRSESQSCFISESHACPFCNFASTTQEFLTDHIKANHIQMVDYISKKCTSSSVTHSIDTSKLTIKCNFCSFVCASRNELDEHLEIVHRITDKTSLNLADNSAPKTDANKLTSIVLSSETVSSSSSVEKLFHCFICSYSNPEKSNVFNHCVTAHLDHLFKTVQSNITELPQETKKDAASIILISDSDDDDKSDCKIFFEKGGETKLIEVILEKNIIWQDLFICYLCHFYTEKEENIKKHMSSHVNFSLYQTIWFQYINSEKEVTPEELYPAGNMGIGYLCDICCLYFTESIKARDHAKMKHSETTEYKTIKFEIELRRESKNVEVDDLPLEENSEKNITEAINKLKLSFRKEGIYICYECKITFLSFTEVRNHFLSQSHKLQCLECDFVFDNLQLLFYHSVSQHKKPLPKKLMQILSKCIYCPFIANSSDHLKKHVNEKHAAKQKTHLCEFCGKRFNSRLRLQIHKQSDHEQPEDIYSNENFDTRKCFRCKYCKFRAFLQVHIVRHVKSVHPKLYRPDAIISKVLTIQSIKCEECLKYFTSVENLQIHRIQTRHYHFCKKCNFRSAYYRQFHIHNYEVHEIPFPKNLKVKSFNCSKCSFHSYFATNLWNHSEKHKNELVYCFVCPKCYSRTDTETSLNKHIKLCNKKLSNKNSKGKNKISQKQVKSQKKSLINAYKKNTCKICSQKFLFKASLIRHQCRTKHYLMCQKCDYTTHIERLFHLHNFRCHKTSLPNYSNGSSIMFLQKWKFTSFSKSKRVQKIIGKQRSFDCNNCNKVFSSFFQLQNHCQQGNHKLKCNTCKYSTSKKISLSVHNLIAHHVKFSQFFRRFVSICKQCRFVTTRSQIFEQHLKKCKKRRYVAGTEIGPFECDICKKSFTTLKRLKKHSDHADHDLHCKSCGFFSKNSKCFSLHQKIHEVIRNEVGVKAVNTNVQEGDITSSSLENLQEVDFSLPIQDLDDSDDDQDSIEIPCPYCDFVVKSVEKLKMHLAGCSLYLAEKRTEVKPKRGTGRRFKNINKKRRRRRYSFDTAEPSPPNNDSSTSEWPKGYHPYSLRERKKTKPLYEEKSEEELLSSTDEYVPSEHEDVEDDDDDFHIGKKIKFN